MAKTKLNDNDIVLLVTELATFSKDPLSFVYWAFAWGEGELAEFSGPDEWQIEILKAVRDGLLTLNQAIQVAIASGHGIGKSALVAWLTLWAISTMEDTRGVVTANTENQLKTKTWAELAKWHRLFIAKDLFEYTATALFSIDKEHEKTWRIDMVPWSERNTEAFAGLHNKGKRVLIIFDEASAIPDVIWEVSEGALTDEDTEILWFAFGNPTRNTGRFYNCFFKFRHRWTTKQIDSRTVKMTNKVQMQSWVDDYGEDSNFVKVRVRGLFPSAGVNQLISSALVTAAQQRHLEKKQYDFAPAIIGVDPAWSGEDSTAIVFRQGLYSKVLAVFLKNDDDMRMTGIIAKYQDEHNAQAVFIDLGYGTGIYSAGKNMGRDNWRLVSFAEKATEEGYANKRAEMWCQMKDWLKEGGHIEENQTLFNDLISPESYVNAAGRIQLESKADMKKRGLPSPNIADALALTFAFPVKVKTKRKPLPRAGKM